MAKTVDNYSGEFKAKVALAMLRGDASPADVSRRFGVPVRTAARWKKQLVDGAAELLGDDRPSAPKAGPVVDTVPDLPSDMGHEAQQPLRFLFTNNLLYWSRLVETYINREFVAEMRPSRVSVTVWRILAWLIHLEPLTVGQLAAYTHMERTVLSRVLDRMAEDGLIRRVRNRDDRRISETQVSAKGMKLFERIQPIRDAIYHRATSGLTEEQLDQARDVYRRMVENLSETSPAAEGGVSDPEKPAGRSA